MSIPCKGNGMTLGMTDGKNNGGLFIAKSTPTTVVPGVFGQNVGTGYTGSTLSSTVSAGVTTDPTKSGVVADLSDGQIVVIKY